MRRILGINDRVDELMAYKPESWVRKSVITILKMHLYKPFISLEFLFENRKIAIIEIRSIKSPKQLQITKLFIHLKKWEIVYPSE